MRIVLLLIVLFPFVSTAQTNTFPSSGNVGIGTMAPNAVLDIAADISNLKLGTVFGRIGEGNTTGEGTFLGVRGYGTQPTNVKSFAIEHSFYGYVNSSINFFRGGGMKGGFLTFNTDDNTERMRITTGGNVGIGTVSPRASFETIGVGMFSSSSTGSGIILDASRLPSTNSWSNVQLTAGGDGGSAYLKTSLHNWGGYFSWTRGSSLGDVEVMRIDATTGNVGIGTSSPTAKLEVAGDMRQSGRTTFLLGANSNQNQAVIFGGWGIAHGGIFWRGDSRTFTLNTGDNADNPGRYGNANLAVTGNVGIGTTPQTQYKLAVNGDAIFTRVKVKTYSTWPDYVFHPSYKLYPLKDLEIYIKQNNHLPDVPSASEVEKDGLDLGGNQAMLLKKIEELTLYIIGQDKKIESQQKQITELLQIKKDLEAIKSKLQN